MRLGFRTLRGRDAARLAVQAAAAGVGTYLACRALGFDEASWAVISALFTVQASVGSTLSKAVMRVAGAVVGLGIGLMVLAFIGIGSPETTLSLGIGIGAMALVSGYRPDLSYGLVTVAILVLSPGGDAIETSWAKAAAIGLGALVGSLAAVSIVPLRAHRRAERHLGRALLACRDLLEAVIRTLAGEERRDVQAMQSRILRELRSADEMARQSQYVRMHRRGRRPSPDALVGLVQRFWHTLVLFDRLDGRALPDRPRSILAGPLLAASDRLGRHLDALGQAMEAGAPPPDPDGVSDGLQAVAAAFDAMRRERATLDLPDLEAERVFALSFALQETERTLDDLQQALRAWHAPIGRPVTQAETRTAA